jgi:acetyl-CoA C-acetyltransferase
MYRKPFSLEEVLGSNVVCHPLTLFMLCSPNEGSAAVLLSASPGPVGPPVRVRAAVLRSHLTGSVLGEHTPMSGLPGAGPPSPTEMAAREAYENAGVDPRDLDLVEVQDTDSGREILSIEELQLCPPSGGLLSKGEPLGASALGQIVELVWQLRGAAGKRQVEGAKLGLGHTVGRGANASVVILSREAA